LVFTTLLCVCWLSVSNVEAASSCSDYELAGLSSIIQTQIALFPNNSLPLVSEMILGLPLVLAAPAVYTVAFTALLNLYTIMFQIAQTKNVSNLQPADLETLCATYNEYNATSLQPLITFTNLVAISAQGYNGVLNSLAVQPLPANFTNAYYYNGAPASVRLALVPNGMVVSWQTLFATTTTPTVKYGTAAANLSSTATGVSHTYGTVYFHDVVISNLNAKTRYYFSISGDVTNTVYNFTTAPAAGSGPIVATIIGDMGIINALQTYNVALNQLLPTSNLFIHIGDISYADDVFLHDEYKEYSTYETTWDVYQSWMTPITSTVPYMVLPGNHEVACQELLASSLCPVSQQNFTAYRQRFRMPSAESGAGAAIGGMWSSFDYGLVHFTMINTETDYPNAPDSSNTVNGGPFGGNGNPTQLEWLASDLQKAFNNRGVVPWIVVVGHRPIYSGIAAEVEQDGFYAGVTQAFQSLLETYEVDLYMSGHLHMYERLYPIANGSPQFFSGNVYTNPTAPTYIVNGAAGNDERHTDVVAYNYTIGKYYNNQNYGLGQLTAHNTTHLQWQFIRSDTGAVDDELWIIQTSTNYHNITSSSTSTSGGFSPSGTGPTPIPSPSDANTIIVFDYKLLVLLVCAIFANL